MSLLRCPKCDVTFQSSAVRGATVRCKSCGAGFAVATSNSNPIDLETVHAETKQRDVARESWIAHYRLIKGIGSGTFGAVWKAHDKKLDRIVAIKVPRQGLLSKSQIDLFLREARAIAKLSHPGIVGVYEIGQTAGGPFIVTEFIDGADLKHELKQKALTIEDAVTLSIALGEALDHAHQHGIVHRDLKPANVMIDRSGRPHVMDFGLAKQVASVDVHKTVDGQIMGTPAYMAPEQARGDSRHVDGRSDVYSLGVMLFEFLTGELPFRGRAAMLLQQVIAEDAPAPRTLNGAVPIDLQNICLKCLEKDPERRYPSAAAYVADLNAFLKHQPVSAKPSTRLQRFNKWCRRNPVVASLIALVFSVLIALCVLSTVFLIHERGIKTSLRSALARETTALRTVEQYAVDLERQRDGFAAARELIASTQGSEDERSRSYGARLYEHDLRDCAEWIDEGKVFLARAKLDKFEAGDPLRVYRCWTWDYLDGSLARKYTWKSARRSRVDRLICNRDGSEVYVLFQSGNLERWMLDGNRFKQLATPIGVNARFRDIDFDSASQTLAMVSDSGELIVYANDDGTLKRFDTESAISVNRVRFRSNGEELALLDNNGSLWILSLPALQPISQWNTQAESTSICAWCQNGEMVVTAAENRLKFWDSRNGTLKGSAEVRSAVASVESTSDGRWLLVRDQGEVWKIDTASFNVNRIGSGVYDATAMGLGNNPDNVWFLSRIGTLSCWKISDGRRLSDYDIHDREGSALCLSREGNRLFAAITYGEVVVTKLNEPPQTMPQVLHHEACVRRVHWHPDGVRLAAADWSGQFSVWDVPSGKRLFSRQVSEGGNYCESATWSPDGKRIATSSTDGSVSIWDGNAGERIATLTGHHVPVYGVAWHPHLPHLASSGPDGVVRIWDIEEFKEIESWVVGSLVEQVAWSKDGNRLFAVGGKMAVRDMQSGELIIDEPIYGTQLFNVAIHPDQTRIAACGSDGTLTIIDLADPTKRTSIRASTAELRGLSWSPDGKCLVTSDYFGVIAIWQQHSKGPTPMLTLRGNPSSNTTSRAWCATFSDDGKKLAVSHESGNVCIWNVEQ